ncbi:MAG: protein RarD [Rhodobacterales bacterium]|nr:MAG: protein RarD [Rhodobacterales bacterium]
MTRTYSGIFAMLGACILWGLSPLLYKALDHVPPLEVLAHRTIWSLVIFVVWLGVQGRLPMVMRILGQKQQRLMIVTLSVLIGVNWGAFIVAVQIGQTVEASLGYFIYPLMTAVLGTVLFREKLAPAQILSVLIAAAAVVLLGWGLGVTPWLALFLAGTFAVYGSLKKHTALGPLVSVTGEVLLLLPLALIWLWGVHFLEWRDFDGRLGGAFGQSWQDTVLLLMVGPVTAFALVLFAFAAKRLSFATQGFLFYLNPFLQFMVAALVFAEPVSRWHLIAFSLIGLALTIYSLHAFAQERKSRKALVNSATPGTTVK